MIPAITLLVFLAALAHGSIVVEIVASDKENEREVHLFGTNVDIISNEEEKSFHLTEDELKEAVNLHFGSKPADVYLKSPTPWGDLYKIHGWSEVKRVLMPIKARILGIQKESNIVLSQIFNNTSTKNATFHGKIQQQVDKTVTSTWSKSGSSKFSLSIEYNFHIPIASMVSGKTSFSYNSKWGENVKRTEKVTVGSESAVEINLGPHESVIVELYASRGVMTVEVDYEASLTGSTVVNYPNVYKGHHFWQFDINSVMSSARLQRTIKSTETIKLDYYFDSKVILRDFKSLSGAVYTRTQ